MRYEIPIENTGKSDVEVEFEPEGNWFTLKPGESCELRLVLENENRLQLSVEISDKSILFYSAAQKEAWRDGSRVDQP